MGPSAPPDPDARPDLVSPVYFNPATAKPATEEDSEDFEEPAEVPADAEERGVRRAGLAALLSVVGIALLLIGPLVFLIVEGLELPFLGSLFGTATLTVAFLEVLLGLIVAGVLLQVVSLGAYGSAFGLVRLVDARFSTPRILSVIGLAGFVLILLGLGALLGFVFQAVSCGSAGSTCLDPGLVLASGIAALLGSVLAFVGWVGLLLGLFRFGQRYESGLLKVAAILMIIPVANLAAPLLAFIALRNVPQRFDLRASAGSSAPVG